MAKKTKRCNPGDHTCCLDGVKKKCNLTVISKLDYSLAPPEFDDVILVLQHSAETGKYGRNDWLEGKNYDTESSIASMKRHIREYREGVRKDKDNGLHPMLMVACRALMQYTLDQRKDTNYQKIQVHKVQTWYSAKNKNDPYPEGYDAEGAEKSWVTRQKMNSFINTDYCNQCKFLKDSQAHKQICNDEVVRDSKNRTEGH